MWNVWLKLAQWFLRRWKCQKFTDRRRTTGNQKNSNLNCHEHRYITCTRWQTETYGISYMHLMIVWHRHSTCTWWQTDRDVLHMPDDRHRYLTCTWWQTDTYLTCTWWYFTFTWWQIYHVPDGRLTQMFYMQTMRDQHRNFKCPSRQTGILRDTYMYFVVTEYSIHWSLAKLLFPTLLSSRTYSIKTTLITNTGW